MELLATPGLKTSLIGGAIFFLGMLSLLFLPLLVPVVAMIVGGALVWGGFIWTIFSYYAVPDENAPVDER
jgi:hypothetical protein